jgi:hypothetical protein
MLVAMTICKGLYVYLQRPDTGAWVTVGRYRFDAAVKQGWFVYASSYLEAGLASSIDPIHLSLVARALKTTVRDGDALWWVKPSWPTYVWDASRLEHFCSLLATEYPAVTVGCFDINREAVLLR